MNLSELNSFSISKVTDEIFASDLVFDQLERLLACWFDAGLHRGSKVDLAFVHNPEHLAARFVLWASLVYKRGFTNSSWSISHNCLDIAAIASRTQNAGISQGAAHTSAKLVPNFTRMSSEELKTYLQIQFSERETLLIIDSGFINCWPSWQNKFTASSRCILYEPSESTKSLATLRKWWQVAKKRNQPIEQVWSIGGGITSDMAAFLAGLFGLEHKSSPTTLLSASDASIGGKTGVNFGKYGKNQLGLFYPTTTWIVVPEHFATLSQSARLCGLAETLKHHWLMGSSEPELAKVQALAKQNGNPNTESEFEIIAFNFKVKSLVVMHDPNERNVRKALNFGHTLAHILEGLGEQNMTNSLAHGLAVLVGMKFLIESKLVAGPQTFAQVLDDLLAAAEVSLPLKLRDGVNPESATAAFLQLARGDKKNEEQGLSREPTQELVSLTVPIFGQLKYLSEQTLNTYEPKDFSLRISIDKFIQLLKESCILYFYSS